MNRWQIDDVFTMTEKLSFNYVRCNIAIVPYKSAIFSSVRDKRNLKLFYDLRKRVSGWIFFVIHYIFVITSWQVMKEKDV